MKLYRLFFLIFLIIFIHFIGANCRSKKDTKAAHSSGSGADSLDSIYIESFLKKYPDFKPHRKKLLKFYSRRNYALGWFQKEEVSPQAGMFVNMLNNIKEDGLNDTKYNFIKLKELYSGVKLENKNKDDAEARKQLDLMLTSSYFVYARDLWRGIIDPSDENIEWYVQKKKIKYGKTLDAILESKGNAFAKFEPLHEEYKKLKNYLSVLRGIEKNGGWPVIDMKDKLQKGDTSSVILKVKTLLLLTGDLRTNNQKNLFDPGLEDAVKKFQKRHGLKEDGVLGGKTIEEMNVPVSSRINQIIINMERWRWVPQNLSANYVLVNIPEFKLKVFENNKEAWNMNVIVGKEGHNTPIFNDELEYIVFSPYWNVPKSIAVNELIPLLQKNPVIIEKENMEVYQGKPENTIDPYSVDWNTINENNLVYQFRQKPGGNNALGKVKFLFPNEYDIYLHDTPSHELFSQTKRGFSHGCIRLEEPQKLAEYLLKDHPDWDKQKIEAAMNSGEEQFVKLQNKLPVYILYFTSWVDDKGNINFRDDIYAHDARLAQSFFEQK
jgi:murein L,D-transpeptidase YcbB/YkuD